MTAVQPVFHRRRRRVAALAAAVSLSAPLQVYRSTVVPSPVPPLFTSRHFPSERSVLSAVTTFHYWAFVPSQV